MKQLTVEEQKVLLDAITSEFYACFEDAERFAEGNKGEDPKVAFVEVVQYLLEQKTESIKKDYDMK